jgi:AbrB family looped-hinge helix DNA binding protein
MKKIEFAKLSSKGQVVIPKKLRFGLEEGSLFVVNRKDDLIILKKVNTKVEKRWEKIFEKCKKAIKKTGLKESDVPKIVHTIRGVKE